MIGGREEDCSSAYGKIILLGEHAVLYGSRALCGAMNRGVSVQAIPGTGRIIVSDWEFCSPPLASLWHGEASANRLCEAYVAIVKELTLRKALLVSPLDIPYDWVVKFHIPPRAGLGASAALSVALVREMGRTLGHISDFDITKAVNAAEQVFHGTASGLDAYIAQFGGFGIYSKQFGFIPLPHTSIALCVGYTGRPKDTRARVEHIAAQKKSAPSIINPCLERITQIVEDGISALQRSDLQKLGALMNENQEQLRTLDASSLEIERLCSLALDIGAFGAKLTGGGGGGCVIALAPEKEVQVLSTWRNAGFSAFLTFLGPPSSCMEEVS